jgi:LPXTG-motif cell wall-anchored protein
MRTRSFTVIGLPAGILVIFVTLLVATLLLTGDYRAASTHAASPSAVRSMTVYEASKAIGDLAEPAPFSVMHVVLTNGEANVELMAKIMPEQDERILVVSALEDQIITALTPEGVVGHSLPGGYEIQGANQEALLRLNGVLPHASRQAMVATIISEGPDGVQILAQVTASVQKNIIPPAVKALLPWLLLAGAVGALVLGAGYFLRRRRNGQSAY